MSITLMSQVWAHSPHKGTELLMLLALADHANDDGQCWPSLPRLAAKCRIKKRQAIKIIQKLEADGTLQIERGQGRGNVSIYTLLLKGAPEYTNSPEKVHPSTPFPPPIKGALQDTKGALQDTKGALASAPEPSVEPSVEPSEEKDPLFVPHGGQDGYSQGFEAFWDCYPQKKGKRQAWREWQRHKLDPLATQLCRSVADHLAHDEAWQRGYIKYPATYLVQGCWQDECTPPARSVTLPPNKSTARTQFNVDAANAVMAMFGGSNGTAGPAPVSHRLIRNG